MGADRWTYCPKCQPDRRGSDDGDCTFREDYEIGVNEGVFELDYRGVCNVCDYRYAHKSFNDLRDRIKKDKIRGASQGLYGRSKTYSRSRQ